MTGWDDPSSDPVADIKEVLQKDFDRGLRSIEWDGASNVAPKRIVKLQPLPWRCPQCQVWIARYWTHCDGCGHPRVG